MSAQSNEAYKNISLALMAMMERYQSMWDGHLALFDVVMHRIVLSSTDAPPLHNATYGTGSSQRGLGREEIGKMRKAGVIESAFTEWASLLVISLRNSENLRFCSYYH